MKPIKAFSAIVFWLFLAVNARADSKLNELPLNPAPTPEDLFYCVSGSTDYRCTLQQIQASIGSNFSYFLTDTVSDIGGYAVMQRDISLGAESSVSVVIPASDTLVKAWGTIAAEPDFTTLIAGVYDIHIHAAKTAGTKDVIIYAKLFSRTAGGVETLLFTSESSVGLTGSNADYNLHGSVLTDTVIGATDRLVVKFYGIPSGAGTDPTVTLYMEGSNSSRAEVKTTSEASDIRYLVKPGLNGGQTAYGGTDSGGDLSLASTSNATKGNINFGSESSYDESLGSWGIGDTVPNHQVDVKLRADDNFLIDARTNARTMTQGAMRFEHTPQIAGTRAVNIDINSNGKSDTNAIVVDYLASNHATGFETHALDVSVDTDGSTGGEFQAISIQKTGAGTLDVAGLETYSGVHPVVQKAGAAVAIDTAFTYSGAAYTDITTAINSTGTNVQLFVADDDYLYIGKTAMFNEIQITLAVLASQTITPIFEYSQGAGVWIAFGPADGTNGFQQNGNIVWAGALIGWAVDTVNGQGGRYWIRIQRTRNSLAISPTESIIKLVTSSEFKWDSNGNLNINAVNASGNSFFGQAGTSSHPVEARKDGAGFQTIAALENQQTAAANVGPQLMFEGASNTDMAAIQSGWNGAATTDSYLAWLTRGSNSLAEKMRLTSAGNLGIGATPVNKLDVEGGAVIGATYSGSSTAPANGLLVEGNLYVGSTTGPSNPRVYIERTVTDGLRHSGLYVNEYEQSTGYTDSESWKGAYIIGTDNATGTSTGAGGQALAVIARKWQSTLSNSLTGINVTYGITAGAGTITNSYGITIGGLNTGGTITNGYGLWIGSTKGSTLSYDIYASTTTAKNYLEGNTGIGTASPTDKLDINSDTIRLRTAKTPASAADTCDGGEIAWDTSYIYVCVAANSWKRSAIAAW